MELKSQVLLAFGAVMLSAALTAGLSVWVLGGASERRQEVLSRHAEQLALVERVRYRSEQVVASSRGYLLTGEARYLERFDAASALVHDLLDDLARGDPADTRRLHALRQSLSRYAQDAGEAAGRRRDSGDPAALLRYVDEVLRPSRDALEAAMSAYVQSERKDYAEALERLSAQSRRAQLSVLLAVGLALALGGVLSVSVLRRLSAQVAGTRAAAEQARRAAQERQDILEVVSHDLRGPLFALSLALNHLRRALEPRQEEVSQLNTADSALLRMRNLIENILQGARLGSGAFTLKRSRCGLAEVLDEAELLMKGRAERQQIELRVFHEAADVDLWVDRDRVLQILSNLLGNALKFTPTGGRVTVRARLQAGFVEVSVCDTGPGISPQELPRLFERRFQGAGGRRAEGLGLGLYIAKALVEAHGGTIRLASEPGMGTTFTFTLPYGSGVTEARPEEHPSGPLPPH